MSAAAFKPLSMFAQWAHWAGCVLATCAVLLFVVFAVGLGLPPLPALNVSFAAVGVMLAGFVLMWWKDWLGGTVSLLAGREWALARRFRDAPARTSVPSFPILEPQPTGAAGLH